MRDLDHYSYRSARALVLLHDRHLRSFLTTWNSAHQSGLVMPPTEDPDCESLPSLLFHVLGCARGYMVWICDKLELPEPAIERPASPEELVATAEAYVDHVLARWRLPLAAVPGERFDRPSYLSSWGVEYCIDAMLEHAVMHPLRHEYQLEQLLAHSSR